MTSSSTTRGAEQPFGADDLPSLTERIHAGLPRALFYATAVLAGVFLVRVLGAGWYTHFHAAWPDATLPKESYRAVALKTPLRPSFYFAYRPIGYPFFLWLFARSSHPTVIAQAALYCTAVITCCVSAWRILHSRVLALVTIALFAGIAVQAKYAMWTTQILSESLAMSLGLLAIATWWRFAAEPTRRRAVWGIVFVIAWMLVRDAHVFPAVIVLVPTLLLLVWFARSIDERVRTALWVGAVSILLAAAYSYVSQAVSERALLSFHNTVGVRIVPDSELSKWFADRGMPLDSALQSRAGKGGLDDNFYRSTDPAFAKYRKWAKGEGRADLVLSMAFEAVRYRDLMYKDLPSMLKADVSQYDTTGVYHRLPHTMPLQAGGPTTRKGLGMWLLFGGGALATATVLAVRHKQARGLVIFGAAGLALSLIEMYATWVGDPLELARHEIGALNRLSMMLVIVISTAVDVIIVTLGRRRNAPHAGEVPGDTPDDEAKPSIDA